MGYKTNAEKEASMIKEMDRLKAIERAQAQKKEGN